MINLVLVVAGVCLLGLSIGVAVAFVIDFLERNEQ